MKIFPIMPFSYIVKKSCSQNCHIELEAFVNPFSGKRVYKCLFLKNKLDLERFITVTEIPCILLGTR